MAEECFKLDLNFFFFLVLTLWFLGEEGPSNPEFSREVSKVWPRIVPLHFNIRIMKNKRRCRIGKNWSVNSTESFSVSIHTSSSSYPHQWRTSIGHYSSNISKIYIYHPRDLHSVSKINEHYWFYLLQKDNAWTTGMQRSLAISYCNNIRYATNALSKNIISKIECFRYRGRLRNCS